MERECSKITMKQETTPAFNSLRTEEKRIESNQEVVNPEYHIKYLSKLKTVKTKSQQANPQLISKSDTVEDFVTLYNLIWCLVIKCLTVTNHFFRIIWSLYVKTRNKHRDEVSLITFGYTVLCLIGKSSDGCSGDVCGALANVRANGDKIAIWSPASENRETVTNIQRGCKEWLELAPKTVISYQSQVHSTKSDSITTNRFTV